MSKVHLLDYVAGNVRSLVNAIEKLGYEVEWIRSPEEVANAEVGSHSPCSKKIPAYFSLGFSNNFSFCRNSFSPASATSDTACRNSRRRATSPHCAPT